MNFESPVSQPWQFILNAQYKIIYVNLLVDSIIHIPSKIIEVLLDANFHEVFLFLVFRDQNLPKVFPIVKFEQIGIFTLFQRLINLLTIVIPKFLLELTGEVLILPEELLEVFLPY